MITLPFDLNQTVHAIRPEYAWRTCPACEGRGVLPDEVQPDGESSVTLVAPGGTRVPLSQRPRFHKCGTCGGYAMRGLGTVINAPTGEWVLTVGVVTGYNVREGRITALVLPEPGQGTFNELMVSPSDMFSSLDDALADAKRRNAEANDAL